MGYLKIGADTSEWRQMAEVLRAESKRPTDNALGGTAGFRKLMRKFADNILEACKEAESTLVVDLNNGVVRKREKQ